MIGQPCKGRRLARLDLEQGNPRLAVDWWMARDLASAVRLVAAIDRCWWRRGRLTELRRWQAGLLPCRHALPRTATLARFLQMAGECLDDRDLASRRALFEESLAIGREVGDQQSVGPALWLLAGDVAWAGDHAAARALYAECLAQADAELQARTLVTMGTLTRKMGDFAEARRLLDEAIARARQTRFPTVIGWSLDGLGKLEQVQGNLTLGRGAERGEPGRLPSWGQRQYGTLDGPSPRRLGAPAGRLCPGPRPGRARFGLCRIPRPPLEVEASSRNWG